MSFQIRRGRIITRQEPFVSTVCRRNCWLERGRKRSQIDVCTLVRYLFAHDASMVRRASTFEDLGPGRMSPRPARLILVAVASLLSTILLQAQVVIRPPEIFQTDALDTPVPFGRLSSARFKGYLHYNSQLGFSEFPAGNYPGSYFLTIAPRRLFMNIPPLPSVNRALWNQENYLMGPDTRNMAAFAPTYGTAPSGTPRTTPGVEQYLRHIPTAGPMMMRIYLQAKAHPRLTRALSMIRPDF